MLVFTLLSYLCSLYRYCTEGKRTFGSRFLLDKHVRLHHRTTDGQVSPVPSMQCICNLGSFCLYLMFNYMYECVSGSPRDPKTRSHRRRRSRKLLRTRRRGCCSGRKVRGRGRKPVAGWRGRRRPSKADKSVRRTSVGGAQQPGGRRQRFPLRPVRLFHRGRGRVSAPHPATPGRHRLLPVPAVRRLLRLVRFPQQAPLHHAPREGHPQRRRTQRRARSPLPQLLASRLPSDAGRGRRWQPGLQGVRPAFRQGLGPQHSLQDPRHGLPHCTQNRQAPVEAGERGRGSFARQMINKGDERL